MGKRSKKRVYYYPFGLTVGIDQNMSVQTKQPYKYQGIELERHFGLEMYETFYRGLDPQLGRFMQVDPKAEVNYGLSPYVSMDNNPVSKIDPRGDLADDGDGDKEKPGAFATGVATLMNAVGIIGRATAPPWTETGSRYGKGPQNASEVVEDFKTGVDMMMILGAPLQMLAAESALPGRVASAEARGGAALETALPEVSVGFSSRAAAAEGGLSVGSKMAITESEALRIGNAAERINKPITLVGSRASGTAKAGSDWDYVIGNMTNKDWKAIKNSLPGAASKMDNTPRMIDIFKGSVNKKLPSITFTPRAK